MIPTMMRSALLATSLLWSQQSVTAFSALRTTTPAFGQITKTGSHGHALFLATNTGVEEMLQIDDTTSLEALVYQHDQGDHAVVCDLVGCAVANEDFAMSAEGNTILDQFLSSYLGPRILLAAVACLYGTNFPLGSLMDAALPASAATSARFVLAGLALSPFLTSLKKDLIVTSLLAGCFTAMGYVSQSVALVDTSPATVSFLGAVIVIWCPFLEYLVDKKPMGWNDRPQTWIAGALCLLGVGILELGGGGAEASISIGMGDGLALLQAIGFGTGLFLSERMMKQHNDQALPITAVLVATTAFWAMVWCLCDGWMGSVDGWEMMTLPNLFFEPSMHDVALAVLWTGLLSTSLNFFLEVVAVGKVPAAEASVILATEPLWAAAFASILLGGSFGWNDYTGGFFIVAACLVNGVQANVLQDFLSLGDGGHQTQPEEAFIFEAQEYTLEQEQPQHALPLQVNATISC